MQAVVAFEIPGNTDAAFLRKWDVMCPVVGNFLHLERGKKTFQVKITEVHEFVVKGMVIVLVFCESVDDSYKTNQNACNNLVDELMADKHWTEFGPGYYEGRRDPELDVYNSAHLLKVYMREI